MTPLYQTLTCLGVAATVAVTAILLLAAVSRTNRIGR